MRRSIAGVMRHKFMCLHNGAPWCGNDRTAYYLGLRIDTVRYVLKGACV